MSVWVTWQLAFTNKSAQILVEVKQEIKPNCASIFEILTKEKETKEEISFGSRKLWFWDLIQDVNYDIPHGSLTKVILCIYIFSNLF